MRYLGRWSVLAGLVGSAACTATTDTPSPAQQSAAEVTVTLPAVHLGADAIQATSAEIQIIPANRAQAVLGKHSLAASQFVQGATVPVNLGPCSGASSTCSALLVVRFLNVVGSMVDSTEAGPFTIVGGGRTTAPIVQPRATVRLVARDTLLRTTFSGAVRAFVDAVDAYGTVLSGRVLQWRSTDPAIAMVDSTGAITARSVGRTTITASREGKSVTLQVEAPAVELFSVTAPAGPVMAKSSAKLSISLLTAPGQSQRVRIESSDSSIAVADANGVVSTYREGMVQFTVRPEADLSRRLSVTLAVDPFRAAISWRGLAAADRGAIPYTPNAVWGADGQAIWTTGCGFISFYDGSNWRSDSYSTQQGFCSGGLTGTSRTDVYAVGNQIWRFNGQSWSRMPATFTGTLNAAAMVGTDVVAVGANGLIVRGQGSTWRIMPSGTTQNLNRISSDGSIAYAVGANGTVLRLINDQWERVSFPNAPQFNDVLVRSASDVLLAGVDNSLALHYLTFRFDGRSWTQLTVDRPQASCCAMQLLFNTTSGIRAFGDDGWIFRLDGSRWVQEYQGQFAGVYNGWAGGSTIMMAGHSSTTFVWRNGTWTRLTSNPNYNAMWAASPNFIVAGGQGGIDQYNGMRWSTMAGDIFRTFTSMWGSSPRDIWAVGWPNTFMHYDGAEWRQQPPSNTASANGIWGIRSDSVWAVFNNGDIMRYNGATWQTIYRARTPLNAIGGSGSRHLIAVGNEGRIWQFNGRIWLQEDSGIDENIQKIWVIDSTQAFAVAGQKLLERRNGVWRSWDFPGANFLWIHGTGPRDVYAGGNGTEILRFDGTNWGSVSPGGGTGYAISGFVFPDGGVLAGGYNRWIFLGTSPLGLAPGAPR